jgi:hypothetical protein
MCINVLIPQEMEARFLLGADTAFGVDYADIDADNQLDDHWIDQRGRDAEDEYFDAAHMEDIEDAYGMEMAEDILVQGETGNHLHLGMEASMMIKEAVAKGCALKDEEWLEEWERMAEQYAASM